MRKKASVHVRQARTSSTYARCRADTSPHARFSDRPRQARRDAVACARGRSGLDVGDTRGRAACGSRPHGHRGRRGAAGRSAPGAPARPCQREGPPARRGARRDVGDTHRRKPCRSRPHGAGTRPLRAPDARPARGGAGCGRGEPPRRTGGLPRLDLRAAHRQQARRRGQDGARAHGRCRAGRRGRRWVVGRAHQRVHHGFARAGLRAHLDHGLRAGLNAALQLLPGGQQPAFPALRAGDRRHPGDGVFCRCICR